jgi:hypothetical protein
MGWGFLMVDEDHKKMAKFFGYKHALVTVDAPFRSMI